MSSPSSGSKNNPSEETSMKQVASRTGCLLGLFIDPKDGGDILLQNVD
jgi:hypothetical protein